MRQRTDRIGERHRSFAAEHRGRRQRAAFVRHMQQRHAGQHIEELAAEMRATAQSGRSEGDFSRLFF
jgi:hypothetical protein